MQVEVRDAKAGRILYHQDLGMTLDDLECNCAQAVAITTKLLQEGKWIGHLAGRVIEFRREGF
jgi:hypothetical protein